MAEVIDMNERYMHEDDLFLCARQIERDAYALSEAVNQGRRIDIHECLTIQKAMLAMQELAIKIREQHTHV